jgi:nitrogen fixation NifU-like protein
MGDPEARMSERIYDEAILAEAKAQSGAGALERPAVRVEADNPLCGDRIALELAGSPSRIEALAHRTRGCLLTRAAASLIGRRAPGASTADLRAAIAELEALLATGTPAARWPELAMFTPVRTVRSRHDCVLLPFRALAEALDRLEGR